MIADSGNGQLLLSINSTINSNMALSVHYITVL